MATRASNSATLEPTLLTAEEFLNWLQPGVHADLIYGEKFMHSPVNFRHANLVNFLDRLLAGCVECKKLGQVYREVIAIRLSSRNVFLPDISFFTNEQILRLKPTHAPFAPAFVAEVLSEWSADRDVGPKFAAYEEHGVQEYWILDPDSLAHRFYHREGEFLVEFAVGAEMVHAHTIPGFFVKRSWLNPDALPEVAVSLREILDSSGGS